MACVTVNELKRMGFFRHIESGIIQAVLNEGSIAAYRKKTLIFRGGAPVEHIFIVLDGKTMIYNITKHGNRKILFILGYGRLLNHSIVSSRTLPVFCEALTDVKLLKIPVRVFEALMEKQPELMKSVMEEYERYIWRLSHQLKNTTGNMQMERKIAAKLWKLGRDFGITEETGVRINIELTITLMADLIGAPRENVSRACKVLADRGLIHYKNKSFTLLDPDGLAQFYRM